MLTMKRQVVCSNAVVKNVGKKSLLSCTLHSRDYCKIVLLISVMVRFTQFYAVCV